MMSRSDELTSQFFKLLDRLVSEQVTERSDGSFDELVCKLPGIYPTDLLSTLERLQFSGKMSPEAAAIFSTRIYSHIKIPTDALPLPHPLDFDWRFSPTSIDHLADSCERLADGGPVILLGTPTIFHKLGTSSQPLEVLLLDSGGHVSETPKELPASFSIKNLDITRDALPKVQATWLLMDPPWYPKHFRSFLWAASALVAQGGSVWTTFPSIGTRPGVEQELRYLLGFAQSTGLLLQQHQQVSLDYVSPPFERAALEATGLPLLPPCWRRADLLVFRRVSEQQIPRPDPPPRPSWEEASVGLVRIKFRKRRLSDDDPRLVSIVPGDVLPSVSTRHPARNHADVWTTCNRVFSCKNTAILGALLRARASGLELEEAMSARRPTSRQLLDLTSFTQHQVEELISLEMKDLERFGLAS